MCYVFVCYQVIILEKWRFIRYMSTIARLGASVIPKSTNCGFDLEYLEPGIESTVTI